MRANCICWMLTSINLLACQHTTSRLEGSKVCLAPIFEMRYEFVAIMPDYMELDVDLDRAKGPLIIKLGAIDAPNTYQIRVHRVEKGVVARIITGIPSKVPVLEVSKILIDKKGKFDPFLLIIRTETLADGRQFLLVRARENLSEKNIGILEEEEVKLQLHTLLPEQMHVSSHHHESEAISVENGHIRKFYKMKSGKFRGKTLNDEDFQNIAEQYLTCLKSNNKSLIGSPPSIDRETKQEEEEEYEIIRDLGEENLSEEEEEEEE